MEKLQKIIKVRMNISKRWDTKITERIEKKKELKKKLKLCYKICELFEKRAFEEVISRSKHFLFFEAKFKCGRMIY